MAYDRRWLDWPQSAFTSSLSRLTPAPGYPLQALESGRHRWDGYRIFRERWREHGWVSLALTGGTGTGGPSGQYFSVDDVGEVGGG